MISKRRLDRHVVRCAIAVVVGAMLTACGGGASSVPQIAGSPVPTAAPTSAPAAVVSVLLQIVAPVQRAGSFSIRIVDAAGSADRAFPTRTFAITAGQNCVLGGGAVVQYTCTAAVSSPVGHVHFAVAAYAAADGSGPALAAGTFAVDVALGNIPKPTLTLAGVPARIAFDRAAVTEPADGTVRRTVLTLTAVDAAGNVALAPLAFYQSIRVGVANDPSAALAQTATALAIDTTSSAVSVTVVYDSSKPLVAGRISATATDGSVANATLAPLQYTPLSAALIAGTAAATLTVAEYGTAGPFTATSSQPLVVAVPASASAAAAGANALLSLTPLAAGNAVISVSDPSGTVASVTVAVTATSAGIVIPGAPSIATYMTGLTPAVPLGAIAHMRDGSFRFTQGGSIGTVDAAGTIGSYVATPANQLEAVTLGPDGKVWFAADDYSGYPIGTVGSVDAGGTVVANVLSGTSPRGIVSGPDGKLWCTENGSGQIAAISPASFAIAEYPLTAGSGPAGITVGSDGNLWFAEDAAHRIGRITTGGALTEFSSGITAGSSPENVALGPDGNVWFTERTGNRIGRITPAGVVTEFHSGISPNAGPFAVAAGHDGNLWFTESGAARIGRITPAGIVTEFPLGGTATANSIVGGAAATLWFTQSTPSAIGKLMY